MDISNESKVLQQFVEMAPYIPMFIEEPVSVAITNRETFIYNQPCAELPVKCNLGVPFPDGNTPSLVMKSGERIVREVSEKVYGIPFKSYAIPLKENGRVVGCLMIAKSITVIKNSKEAITNLSDEIEQVTAAVNEIAEGVQKSSENNHEVYRLMGALLEETQKMNHILTAINKLSNSTKILGLNASIESARAGAAGRGFSVVAKEIERLSSSTTQSAKEIGDMLGSIEVQLNNISERSKETTDTFMQQAASLEEIAATMQNLNANVKVIDDYVQQL
ncbi:MAG: hypothetical protein IKK33_07375 [Lachnospiraceae bacterium]|nr:hypothetical protein [Lachnospiraceae bacterium]